MTKPTCKCWEGRDQGKGRIVYFRGWSTWYEKWVACPYCGEKAETMFVEKKKP